MSQSLHATPPGGAGSGVNVGVQNDASATAAAVATSASKGGSSSSKSEIGDITINPIQESTQELSIGDIKPNQDASLESTQSVGNIQPMQSIHIESNTKIPPQMPGNYAPGVGVTPQIFSQLGVTHMEAGLGVMDLYSQLCPIEVVAGVDSRKREWSTNLFSDEEIYFTPDSGYLTRSNQKRYATRATVLRPGETAYVECVGLVTATAKSGDASKVSYTSLVMEVMTLAVKGRIKADSELIFVFPEAGRVVARGVGSRGHGFGVGGGGSNSPTDTIFGGSMGYSFTKMNTQVDGRTGFTGMVFVRSNPYKEDNSKVIQVGYFEDKEPDNSVSAIPGNGNEAGKKATTTSSLSQ
ncbi:MAG: hypothetical protein H6779_01790 [Candidatus Nomurabacteria bacterium]|nr:MAG: hypothetical protein H6779_01790 [Candidatus Nomurabacteria bacterium]